MKNSSTIKNQIKISIILVGSSYDGKTAIFNRYFDNSFIGYFISTLGVDSKFKKMKMEDGTEVNVHISDTAGQERFHSIAFNCCKKADGIIINYDITDKQSFNEGEKWINEIKERYSSKEKVLFIVGNKNDLEDKRRISKEEGDKLSKKYGVMFSECSAKTGENVDFIFNELIKKCYPLAIIRREKEEKEEKEKKRTKKEKNEEKKIREKEEKEEKKRREIEEKKRREIEEQEENKRREIEEQERWKIEEEKAKKNLKILDKYISF